MRIHVHFNFTKQITTKMPQLQKLLTLMDICKTYQKLQSMENRKQFDTIKVRN